VENPLLICDNMMTEWMLNSNTQTLDLVVGTHGLGSRVRKLLLGPSEPFERKLGMNVAALEIEG